MPTTTNVPQVKINIMDKATFAGITPSPTELYFITDTGDEIVDYQLPTSQNNYTWYRKYKSGWVEQGGKATKTNTANQQQTFTMPVQMANNEYQVQAHIADDTETDFVFEVQIKNQTATGFDVRLIASYNYATWVTGYNFVWMVCGMAV